MDNTGRAVRTMYPVTHNIEDLHVGYVPGDAYTPFSLIDFSFARDVTLDQSLAITDIQRTTGGFSFNIHADYIETLGVVKSLSNKHTFGNSADNVGRFEDWSLEGSYNLSGTFTSTSGSDVTFEASSAMTLSDAASRPEANTLTIDSGASVTFENNSSLTLGQYAVVRTAGTLTLNTGATFNGVCAELIALDGGVIQDEAGTDISGSCACTMPDTGGMYALGTGRTLRYTNGGFLANQAGTYTLASGAEIDLTSTAEKVHILPGSTFDLASSAEVRIAIDDSRLTCPYF